MRESVTAFFKLLHREHLQPRGYTKQRHTFSRDMPDYTERVQFQGSSWNSASGPWTFYVNFGVEFADLQPRTPCRDFSSTHCWTRIEHLVSDAPEQYNISDADTSTFAAEIAATSIAPVSTSPRTSPRSTAPMSAHGRRDSPQRPNQAMQLTAGRSGTSFNVTSTSRLQSKLALASGS